MITVFAALAVRGAGELGLFSRSIRERLFERRQAYAGFAEDLAFLRGRVSPGEQAEFFSYAEPVYYLETGARALSGPGLIELFRRDELDRLFAAILASPRAKVFADKTILDVRPGYVTAHLNVAVVEFLKSRFRPAADSPSGRIVAFERIA